MAEIAVKQHWIVARFAPSDEDDDIGAVEGVDTSSPHDTYEEAAARARALASQNPGNYYVIYEALFYAHTDEPSVHLVRVTPASTS